MQGLNFQAQKPVTFSAPNRMDIACFVGLVDVRSSVAAEDIYRWLYEQGWMHSRTHKEFKATHHRNDAVSFLDVPVPIENWETFDSLFAWNQRTLNNQGLIGTSYLGSAVRSFFAQGGRKCYVVRVGTPLPLSASKTERDLLIEKIVPGFPGVISTSKADRSTWKGIGHLFGLPDVSLLCMPDLPDLVQTEVAGLAADSPDVARPAEQFVECSGPVSTASADRSIATIPAPRTDRQGYLLWRDVIHQVARFIAGNHREVQLLAAIPLPDSSTVAISNLLSFMHQESWLSNSLALNGSIASAFVQLSYPWLVTPGAQLLAEQLEPPDGAMAGMLARNALNKGAYRSVTTLKQTDISGLFPQLSQERMFANNENAPVLASPNASLIDRVSLFGKTPEGISIISDVTTSNLFAHRPANINRIISLVVRAVRRAGEEFVFESNGETLWSDLKRNIDDLLLHLFNLGALNGKQPEDAFFVRCDRSTMTQNDIDNGRVIAEIHIEPAASIEAIDIILAMDQSGQVLMLSSDNEAAVA